jgi:hypothetical protein
MFFTRENGQRLDAMREQIEHWDKTINYPFEKSCLLSAVCCIKPVIVVIPVACLRLFIMVGVAKPGLH